MTERLWKEWKECSRCGIVIDPDERHCPVCNPEKNPRLKLVELDDDEIRALEKKGKVWTRKPVELRKRLFK